MENVPAHDTFALWGSPTEAHSSQLWYFNRDISVATTPFLYYPWQNICSFIQILDFWTSKQSERTFKCDCLHFTERTGPQGDLLKVKELLYRETRAGTESSPVLFQPYLIALSTGRRPTIHHSYPGLHLSVNMGHLLRPDSRHKTNTSFDFSSVNISKQVWPAVVSGSFLPWQQLLLIWKEGSPTPWYVYISLLDNHYVVWSKHRWEQQIMWFSFKEMSSSAGNQVVNSFPWESGTLGAIWHAKAKIYISTEEALGEDRQQP